MTTFNVLFLCTGNSARSILAEALANSLPPAAVKFRGYSAGSHPKGQVHPLALELLMAQRIPIDGLRSKSWDEFAAPGAPLMDLVITVCDPAAAEPCPIWPGHPMTAHWGVRDPAAVDGSESDQRAAFLGAYEILQRRIELLASLPVNTLSRLELQRQLDDIGKQP